MKCLHFRKLSVIWCNRLKIIMLLIYLFESWLFCCFEAMNSSKLRALFSIPTLILTLFQLFSGDTQPCGSTPESWPWTPAAVSSLGNLLLQLHVACSSSQLSPELHAALWHGHRLGHQAPASGLGLGRFHLRHHPAPAFLLVLLLTQALSSKAC